MCYAFFFLQCFDIFENIVQCILITFAPSYNSSQTHLSFPTFGSSLFLSFRLVFLTLNPSSILLDVWPPWSLGKPPGTTHIRKQMEWHYFFFFFRGKDFKRETGKHKETPPKEFEANTNMTNNPLSTVSRFLLHEISSVLHRSNVN